MATTDERYIPGFESQTDERAPTPWTNCTLAAGAMFLDWWTWGVKTTSDIILRQASGIPLTQGVNFAGLAKALKAVSGLTLRFSDTNRGDGGNAHMTWDQLRDHMAAGGFVVAAGNYAELHPFKSSTGLRITRFQPWGSFGHAICAGDYNRADGTYLHMDPLGRGTYTGDRAPIEALWDFLYKEHSRDASARVTVAHSFAGARPERIVKETRAQREQRIAEEVVALRKAKPKAYQRWLSRTGLTQDDDGSTLTRLVRLTAEVSHLREAPKE